MALLKASRRALWAALMAAGLGGCALDSDKFAETVMSDPLKYEFYDCKQMDNAMKGLTVNAKRLEDLIARAEQDAVGVVVATAAYKNEYLRVRGDMKVLRETQVRRNCLKQTEQNGISAVH